MRTEVYHLEVEGCCAVEFLKLLSLPPSSRTIGSLSWRPAPSLLQTEDERVEGCELTHAQKPCQAHSSSHWYSRRSQPKFSLGLHLLHMLPELQQYNLN
ncbi:hypothetical protein PFLUV_G00035670 [Perca fluviatilis]|uniref:Uncharacterized protein n=1 Tax=Perca fluviatilis TaxID=8168 RepID=A0A6A5FKU9_PERFL|nr:hypothetical protein PFLUV_G00035670 [Perca fluviatilis]